MEVLDSAIKIGLGAFISACASVAILKRTQKHEIAKDKALHLRELNARKKALYVDFLTASHVLVQKYREEQCRADKEDYFDYLRLYHELIIIADDPLRISAHNLLNAVNQFIVFRKDEKNQDDRDLFRAMRAEVDKVVAEFQFLAKQEIQH